MNTENQVETNLAIKIANLELANARLQVKVGQLQEQIKSKEDPKKK